MAEKVLEIMSKEDEKRLLQEELNIDQEKLEHYMKLFLEWLVTQKNLPQNFGENCIKKFMIWSKLDLEKCKKRFQRFCYNTVSHEEYFGDRVISKDGDLKILDSLYIVSMPKLTPNGHRINIFSGYNAERYDVTDLWRFATLIDDLRLRLDCPVTGEILIYDFGCFKPQDYPKLFNATCFKFMKHHITNYPYILRHIFIVNCHPLLEKGITICKSILPKKIGERIVTLADPKDLMQYIPLDSLPSNYGGKAKSLKELQTPIIEHFLDNKEFYVEMGKVKPSGPIPEEYRCNLDNEFGVEGSFRRLNID